MTQQPNGEAFKDYKLWEIIKQPPYDYEREGLVGHIISKPLAETDNPVLQFVLKFYESSIVFLLKYIDELKHFKDIHWKNR
jgi:hypothetical protein